MVRLMLSFSHRDLSAAKPTNVSLDNTMEMEDLPAESYEEVQAPNPLPIPPKSQPKKAQNKSQNATQKVDSSRYAQGTYAVHYTSKTENVSLDNKMEMEDLPAESYEEVQAPNPLPIPPKSHPKIAQNKPRSAIQKVDSSRYAQGAYAAHSKTEKVSLDNKMEMEDLPAESYEEVKAPNPLPIPPKPQPKKTQNKPRISRYAQGAQVGPKPAGSHKQVYSQGRSQTHYNRQQQQQQQQQQQPVCSDLPMDTYEWLD